MVSYEILWNPQLNEYTLEKEIEGTVSIKRRPIKYKRQDSTAKYRKDLLKQEILQESS